MTATASVQPGDWFVVDPGGQLFGWIELGERLIDGEQAEGKRWGHSGVASRWLDGQLMCVEAEPGGAVERPWRWESRPHLWSTGTGLSVPSMATTALVYYAGMEPDGHGGWEKTKPGVGYAFVDYVAIAAHRYHLHPLDNLLKTRMGDTGHVICSQLTDQCAEDASIHLFSDKRWPGYVTPLDLGMLLGG